MAELHIAWLVACGAFRCAQRVTGDTPAHVLKAHLARLQGLASLGASGEHQLAQYLVLDERENLVVTLVLVMVAVDVGDQDVIEAALIRLTARVGKQSA